jgi:hypothetical protein
MPALQIDDADIMAYVDVHWEECEQAGGAGRWNGRQIRNAFQTATAIALYEAHMNNANRLRDSKGANAAAADALPPRLQRRHFEKVAHATLQFDEYMEETIGKDDVKAAWARGDRADHFQSRRRLPKQRTHSPAPSTAAAARYTPSRYPQGQYAHQQYSATPQTRRSTVSRRRQHLTPTKNASAGRRAIFGLATVS